MADCSAHEAIVLIAMATIGHHVWLPETLGLVVSNLIHSVNHAGWMSRANIYRCFHKFGILNQAALFELECQNEH